MFDLRDVATYIAKRVGLTPGRVWFGAGNAINAKLTAQQEAQTSYASSTDTS